MIKKSLVNQLIVVCIFILLIVVTFLGVILPNNLIPVYEANVYNYLRQPLSFVQNEDDINNNIINTEVAYLYITPNLNLLLIII